MDSEYVLVLGEGKQAASVAAILQGAGISNKMVCEIRDAISLTVTQPPAGVIFANVLIENEPFWEVFSQIRFYAPTLVSIVVKGENVEFHKTLHERISYGEEEDGVLIVYQTPYTAANPLLGQNGLDGSPTIYLDHSNVYLEKELPAFVKASMFGN